MDREEARRKVMEIRKALTGHPPGDPRNRLEQIEEILHPSKRKRRDKSSHDREERGGFDRGE